MQKIPRKPRLRGVPRIAFAAALTALTLWTVGVAATAHSLSDAAERLRQETALPLALLRYEMGGEEADELSLGASLALSLTPILADARSEVTQAWSSELQLPPDETKPDTEDHEGTTLSDAQTGETVPRGADNGVPSRTLRVGDPSGYTVLGNVCINNGSSVRWTLLSSRERPPQRNVPPTARRCSSSTRTARRPTPCRQGRSTRQATTTARSKKKRT